MDNNMVIKKQWFIKSRQGKVEDYYVFDKKELGSGSYGRVFSAKIKDTNQVRAIKVIPKSKVKNPDRFTREIDIMRNLDHPNIIKLFETFEDLRNVYLVMEVCTGGELFDRIIDKGHYTEKEAQQTFLQIMQALNYCHTNGICHRDLKPENFLLLDKTDNSPIKVIDFGLSVIFNEGHCNNNEGKVVLTTRAGTPYYISPEVLEGKYDQLCDIWSAGVILYILLTGVPPFNGANDTQILNAVKKGTFRLDIPELNGVSDYVKDFLSKLICKPNIRLTAEQALKHPWLNKADVPQSVLTLNLQSLKGFSACNKLKKVALTYMASQMSEQEISELGKLFKQLDKNGDGQLTVDEVKEGLTEVHTENQIEIQAILKAIDTDASGAINYTEFLAATMEKSLYMKKEKLLQAFQMFDTDGSGKISSQELRNCLGENETYKDDKVLWNNLIKEADTDGDGEIDYLEFVDMMDKIDKV